MQPLRIERLTRTHDRRAFDCGNPPLNDWLKQRASQYDKRDLARTYVAVVTGEAVVRGYYAIASHSVSFELLPEEGKKGQPRIDVPVVLIGQLAVDRTAQGRGLGESLLIDALRRVERLSDQIGVRAAEVRAIDEDARKFYLKYGFAPLLDDRLHLFLPVSTIRRLDRPGAPGC